MWFWLHTHLGLYPGSAMLTLCLWANYLNFMSFSFLLSKMGLIWSITQLLLQVMSPQESRSSAGPDHVTLQALITWLIKYRSRDWACNNHVAIMHWSRDRACTDDVADRALITWLIKHWSPVYQAVISDWQALIMGLCMHWSRAWSETDHLTAHALITWLIVHWSR